MNKVILLFLSCVLFSTDYGSFGSVTDDRDGKTYKTFKVGDLNVMLENLNYAADGSRCFRDSEDFCKVYGRVYDYETAMAGEDYEGAQGICPNGWNIPTAEQWIYLIQNSGGKLKYEKGSKASALLPKNIFDLKLAGNISSSNDQFFLIGKKGFYMTSSTEEGRWVIVDFSKNGKAFDLTLNNDSIKKRGISCRCVQYSE